MDIKSDWYLTEDTNKARISLQERIETLVAVATKTTMGFEPTGSRKIGGTQDRKADIVLKIMDLEAELAEIDYDYRLSRCAMICNIALVPKEKRKIFIDRYVRNMSLAETARANGITKKTVCQTLRKF